MWAVDGSSRWRHYAGTSALQMHASPLESPLAPGGPTIEGSENAGGSTRDKVPLKPNARSGLGQGSTQAQSPQHPRNAWLSIFNLIQQEQPPQKGEAHFHLQRKITHSPMQLQISDPEWWNTAECALFNNFFFLSSKAKIEYLIYTYICGSGLAWKFHFPVSLDVCLEVRVDWVSQVRPYLSVDIMS